MKKKPFFKKWWFWLILIIAIGAAGSGDTTDVGTQHVQTGLYAVANQNTDPVKSEVTVKVEKVVEQPVESPTVSEPIKEEPKQEEPKETVKETTPTVVPKQKEEVKPKEVKPVGTDYIGNKNTKKFHYTWCSSVDQMKQSNKFFYTGTREEMIAKGYKSCGRCHP